MNDGNNGPGGWDEGGAGNGNVDDLDGLRLDGAIDQALGSYTAREPRAGLESRVLSHIAAAEAERSGRGWSWKPAWALAAAMALLAVAGIPLSYRLGRQETAVVHGPEVRRPVVAEVRHAAQSAPSAARSVRHTFTRPLPARGRVAPAEFEGMEIAANTRPSAMERGNDTPIDNKPPADEANLLKPITLKPITIAPIQIAALN